MDLKRWGYGVTSFTAAEVPEGGTRTAAVELGRRRAWPRLAVWGAYALVAAFVTGAWFHFARTELQSNGYSSIIENARGNAPSPFVKRRLMPDAARLVTAVLPPASSSVYDALLAWNARIAHEVRAPQLLLTSQSWPRDQIPLLVASVFLLAAAVFGFALVNRALLAHFFETPHWVADLYGGLLALALLGSSTDRHYQLYAYDYPQAFIFALGLLGIVRRAGWLYPVVLLAAYSKETSLLLLLAFGLVTWVPGGWRRPRWWLPLGLLAAGYASIRIYIAWRYPVPEPETFWFPLRNLRWFLKVLLFWSWLVPPFLLALFRILRVLPELPAELRRLCLLVPVVVAAAFFKGWVEELRAYCELSPIAGIVIVYAVVLEAGLGHLLKVRPLAAAPSAPTPASAT